MNNNDFGALFAAAANEEEGQAAPVYQPTPLQGGGETDLGDALRADAVAYWKMDETSGTRADSTGNGNNLVEVFGDPVSVASAAGKIGNAAKIFDNTIDSSYIRKMSINYSIASGWTLTGWVWFPQLVANDNGYFETYLRTDALNPVIHLGIINAGANPIGLQNYTQDTIQTLAPSAWHFFAAWQSGTTMFLQVDGGAVTSGTAEGIGATLTGVEIGLMAYVNNTDYILYDEMGVWNRILTSAERAYLYNGGAGRSLY